MPTEGDLPALYENYSFTHKLSTESYPRVRDILNSARAAYHAGRLPRHSQLSITSSVLGRLTSLLPGFRAQWDAGIFFLIDEPPGKVLEIGCGNGSALERLVELGWLAEGIDFDPQAVEVAKSRGMNVEAGTVWDRSYQENSFDAIVMNHVIEHVPDPLGLLRECNRILKPGGRLVSITPNASSWGHHRFGRDWFGLDAPRHLHIFAPSSMQMIAVRAGFAAPRVSSIAASAHIFLLHSSLLRQGSRSSTHAVPSFFQMFLGRWLQLVEWGSLQFNSSIGEELLLDARKSANLGVGR